MKSTIQTIKTALLCFLMFAFTNSYAQLFPVTFTTTQGQCVDLQIDSFLAGSGLTLDSFSASWGPLNGELTPGGRPDSWIYCPDSGFVGTDQSLVYYCISGGTFPFCDSAQLTFVVQPNGCNMTVAVQTGPCAGPLPSLAAVVTGGTLPYSYLWNDASTNDVLCNLTTGTYCVTVIDANGCSASSCQSVTGGGCNLSVVVQDSFACIRALLISMGTPPYTYLWSDSSTNFDICNPNPVSPYCVTVTDAQGCTASACNSFGCNLFGAIAQSGNCLVTTVTGGTPGYTFQWNEGSTTTSICPNNPGTYCVTITDAQGCTDVQCGTVGGGCQITATIVVDSLNNCLTVAATGGMQPYQYLWSDGSVLNTSTLCNIISGVSYCVSVVDAVGCVGTACNGIGQPCIFTYTQNGPALQTVVVFVASFDQQLNPANIGWDLGDGNTGSGTTLTHIYDTCNVVYSVTMILTDSLGNNLCTFTQPIYISCSPDTNRFCQAKFTSFNAPDTNGVISSFIFHFVDQSFYNPVSFAWDFGDGNFSTVQNPMHTYATTGIYNVCLVMTDPTGCTSTTCKQVNAGNIPVQDLSAHLFHYTTVTPGFPLWVDLTYCNYGTIQMNGTVEYRYPVGTVFVSATPTPIAHDVSQRLLTFNFSNLLPGSCRRIAVDLTVNQSLPLGSISNDTMWVKPISGDINPANNISTISETVIGSWDPNDKAVSPKGIGDDGEIPVNTETLSYKIRFQNTGSAPAVNVVIRDAMDSNIDLTSMQVMDASHEHITDIIGNELVVTFNNILLPDSNSNEPESHGFIQVVANLKPGLTEGTQIFNTAEIYFDFNEPVITNTVVNTLKDATGIRQLAGFEFNILPNPAQEQILLSGKFSRNAQFEIINELGQIVLSDDVTSDKMLVDIKALKTGIFFVKIISSDKTGVQRLVVSR